MLEVILTYRTDETSGEIPLEDGKITFGRGSEADYRFGDDGLSRIHATIYREGDNVWVTDENSTNGSFVNGEKVKPNGTILLNGDKIKIGNYTTLTVKIGNAQSAQSAGNSGEKSKTVAASGNGSQGFPMMIPLALAGIAILVIGASAAFIGFKVLGGGKNTAQITEETPYQTPPDDITDENDNKNSGKSPKPSASVSTSPSSSGTPETIANTTVETKNDGTTVVLPKGKYQDMSDDDKNRYIAVKSEKIARIIGNQKSDPIPAEAVQQIKSFLSGYVNRVAKSKNDSCEMGKWVGSDFTSVLTRATRTSPFVVRSFRAEGIEPQIGIYVAMIEGEHCPCLTSPTGAKGMFQFLASSAPDYGLAADQRCDPEQSAKAGAKYLKTLIARFGTAPDSVPLAIASFNAGQGNLSKNLDTVFAATGGQNRSFWTLAANKGILQGGAGKQFVSENIKYVPKFFAAAIIGENPQDFGVSLQPLSTYTK